ncbi:MAG: hypothetical protein V4604_14500 [Bacteroidota bacterium]
MKAQHILILLFLICGLGINAQVNTSVRSANCIGTGVYGETIALDGSGNCIGGVVKLYYQLTVAQNAIGVPNLGNWSVTSGTYTFNAYGPFTDLETAYNQVESGLVSPVYFSATPSTTHSITFGGPVTQGQVYIIELILADCSTTLTINRTSTAPINAGCQPISLICDDCLGQFQPTVGTYVFSAWTKEVGAPVTKTSYTYPSVDVKTVIGMSTTTTTMLPVGDIIDGWQQMTGTFDIPVGMTAFRLEFIVGGSGETALFDDIRIFPFDGSMMSYVYDPITLRLVAELDERNYAKLYEYDEEGKLVRVKKETEKGILTIMENRENSVKKP